MPPQHRPLSAIAVALLLPLASTLCTAQERTLPTPLEGSREFWGVFQRNFRDWMKDDRTDGLRRSDPLELGLSITAERDATVKVEIPGIGFTQQVKVFAGTRAWVPVDTAAQMRSSMVPERLAFHITSDAPVIVTGSNHRSQTTDLFQVLPTEALGTRYRAMGYKHLVNELVSQFAVIATEDNTVVRITPSTDVIGIPAAYNAPKEATVEMTDGTRDTAKPIPVRAQRAIAKTRARQAQPRGTQIDVGTKVIAPSAPQRTPELAMISNNSAPPTLKVVHPANVPVEIRLKRGEVVQVVAKWSNDKKGEITGTLIESSNPVAVFSGHNCAYVPTTDTKACNTLAEQMPPTSTWGSRFVVAPLERRTAAVLRVLADHDSTVVSMNGAVVATIGPGEWYENTEIREPAMIATSKPALAALFTPGYDNGDNIGDPSMTVVPPLHQHALAYRLLSAPMRGSWYHTLLLAVPEEGLSSLRLNEAPIATKNIKKITGSNYAVVQVGLQPDAQIISCDKPFGAMQFGVGYNEAAYDAYGFSYGYPIPDPALVAEEEKVLAPHGTAPEPPVAVPATAQPTNQGSGATPPKVER